jgi:hypothetical protein
MKVKMGKERVKRNTKTKNRTKKDKQVNEDMIGVKKEVKK